MGETSLATMDDDDSKFDIETTDSGAAQWENVEAGTIRKGGYIMIKGKACKVRDVTTSKTGKHGHAKCKFQATDIFTGATCEELCPSSHTIGQPFVAKTDWSVTGITDGEYVNLMNDDGDMREDLKLPTLSGYNTSDDQDVSTRMLQYVDEMENQGLDIEIFCTVMAAIGKEKIIDVRKKDA